jgi:hypothetical protein
MELYTLYVYRTDRGRRVLCSRSVRTCYTIYHMNRYATVYSTEIDRHRSRTQCSAIDFQIANYFQMGSTLFIEVRPGF